MPETSHLNYLTDLLTALGAIVAFGTLIGSGIYRIYLARKERGYAEARKLIDSSQMAATSKEIVKDTLKSMRRTNRISFIVLSIMGTVSIVMLFYEPTDQATLSRYLSKHDPDVFRHSRSKLYDIARTMPDRDSLVRETDFGATLDRTKKSFDLVARHGGSVTGDYQTHIIDALKRGVSIRLVVYDPDESNQTGLEMHANATDRPTDRVRDRINESLQKLSQLMQSLDDAAKKRLQVRLHQGTLLHSMWIRDRDTDHTVAHLGMYFHRPPDYWPSFRVSQETSSRLVENAVDEFERIWQRGKPWTPSSTSSP